METPETSVTPTPEQPTPLSAEALSKLSPEVLAILPPEMVGGAGIRTVTLPPPTKFSWGYFVLLLIYGPIMRLPGKFYFWPSIWSLAGIPIEMITAALPNSPIVTGLIASCIPAFVCLIIMAPQAYKAAWERGHWESQEKFIKTQRAWDIAAIIVLVLTIAQVAPLYKAYKHYSSLSEDQLQDQLLQQSDLFNSLSQ